MKKILIYNIFLFLGYILYAQEIPKDTIYLSYNISKDSLKKYKYKDDKGYTNFHIGKEHFISKESPKKVCGKNNINKLININEFIREADNVRENLLKKEKKTREITILSKSNIFDVIYLYERVDDEIFIYKVEWVEETS